MCIEEAVVVVGGSLFEWQREEKKEFCEKYVLR